MGSRKIEFIQAFRGVAALMVVFYHGSRFISPYGTGLGDKIFGAMGSLGVSLFFVISGFIMALTTTSSDGSLRYFKTFAIKRISRVWPAYVIATLALIVFVRYGIGFFSASENIINLLYTISFIPYGELAPPSFGYPLLAVGWTLNFEMYFYLIFGLSLLFGKLRWVIFSAWIVISLILLPYFTDGYFSFSTGTNYRSTSNYFHLITSPIIWQFCAGVLIGWLYKKNIAISSHKVCYMLMFITLSAVLVQYLSRYEVSHGINGWGLTIIPMFLVFVIASKTVTITAPSYLVYLGNISFSLYLWHPFSQEILPGILERHGLGVMANGAVCLILTTVMSIVIASLSHHFIEEKLSNLIKNGMMKVFVK